MTGMPPWHRLSSYYQRMFSCGSCLCSQWQAVCCACLSCKWNTDFISIIGQRLIKLSAWSHSHTITTPLPVQANTFCTNVSNTSQHTKNFRAVFSLECTECSEFAISLHLSVHCSAYIRDFSIITDWQKSSQHLGPWEHTLADNCTPHLSLFLLNSVSDRELSLRSIDYLYTYHRHISKGHDHAASNPCVKRKIRIWEKENFLHENAGSFVGLILQNIRQ